MLQHEVHINICIYICLSRTRRLFQSYGEQNIDIGTNLDNLGLGQDVITSTDLFAKGRRPIVHVPLEAAGGDYGTAGDGEYAYVFSEGGRRRRIVFWIVGV